MKDIVAAATAPETEWWIGGDCYETLSGTVFDDGLEYRIVTVPLLPPRVPWEARRLWQRVAYEFYILPPTPSSLYTLLGIRMSAGWKHLTSYLNEDGGSANQLELCFARARQQPTMPDCCPDGSG